MFDVAVITASDKGSQGLREDLSGRAICEIMEEAGYSIHSCSILPDEQELLSAKMIELTDKNVALILTTGGTGFSLRDRTPEATLAVIDRQVPGIPEAMRFLSLQITKRAMLSRATAGIRQQTLIVNLPGSPKAVKECLEFILDSLEHGLKILRGEASECAR
ncbi:MAG: molybdopterin adenylyltransferase [Firmicutes bacterium]|nr:molybdopterin adenylyltransferase [Bacillota bacterium]